MPNLNRTVSKESSSGGINGF